MSTAKRSKKAKTAKPKARAAARRARPKASKAKATKAAPRTKATARPTPAKERAHCIATDPFGDPCQSAPRLPSKYCTIHSYLDR